jgi:hypothetical protein
MNKKLSILLTAILLLGIFGMLLLLGSSNALFLIAILALFIGLFAWAMPLILKRVNTKVWSITGFIILFGLLFPTSSLMSGNDAGTLSTLAGTTIFFLPSLALVDAAFLLYSGLTDTVSGRLKNVSLGLCFLLIIRTLYNLYVLTLWDNTYDPLGYLWLIVPIYAALLSGLTLSIALSDGKKLAGPLYTILATVLLISVSALAQHIDFRQETTRRAERTVQAIESYHERNGNYPETLSQLTPRYILSLPKPMIIYGQDWCYQSGSDYYRLGYIDRGHWSNPNLIGRVYKSVGEESYTQSICMDAFKSIQNSHPDYPYAYHKESK